MPALAQEFTATSAKGAKLSAGPVEHTLQRRQEQQTARDENQGIQREQQPANTRELGKLRQLWKALSSTISRLFGKIRPKKVSPATSSSRWWCVVIGIGEYTTSRKLAGPSHDAKAMQEFLTMKLGLSESQVALLVDREATRDKIISTFDNHLLNNPRMKKGDKRLIYFAGHGASYEASECFATPMSRDMVVDAICPVDRGLAKGRQPLVYDISHRELCLLFRAMNEMWGPDNVLILDCCYGESIARDRDSSELELDTTRIMPRVVPPLRNAGHGMLKTAKDNQRWDNNPALDKRWEPDMETHVVLAACAEDEQAVEVNRRGMFTRALLSTLGELGPGECTWEDAVRRIGPQGFQTPQVLGRKGSRLWFG